MEDNKKRNHYFKDVTGEVHNRFTIIGLQSSRRDNGGKLHKRVLCKCECGVEKVMDYREIKRNKIKSCGCLSKEQKINVEINQTWGHWVLLEELPQGYSTYGRTMLCRCICSKEKPVLLQSLCKGASKSCGCMGIPPKEKIIKEKYIPYDIEEEQWKESVTFTGLYISSLGRVFNYNKQVYKNIKGNGIEFREKQVSLISEMHKVFFPQDKLEYGWSLYFEDDIISIDNICKRETSTVRFKKLIGVYGGMRSRCYSINDKSYRSYGSKSIIIEKEWNTSRKFFDWAVNNRYEDGLEIDRIDPTKNYCSANCRFITKTENVLHGKFINLTIEDVLWIRSDDFTYKKALEKFTCSKHTIKNIRDNVTFKNVTYTFTGS